MGIYQLFIQKSKVIFFLVALSAIRLAVAAPHAKDMVSSEILKSIPEGAVKLFNNQKYIWTEYCPDNTCDIVRSKSNISVKLFSDLAAAYYYYFSKYDYLESWQRDPTIAKSIDESLILSNKGTCQTLSGKELARCRLKLFNAESGLQFFFIRFDEGRRTKMVISIVEALR